LPNPDHIAAKLNRAQGEFLRTADGIPPEVWRARPPNGGWSAGEIVAHLCQVERAILGGADRIIQQPAEPVPFYKRFHVPLVFVEARLVRRMTPIPLDPDLLEQKDAMLAALRGVRERTLAFLAETRDRNLSSYYWPHPFLGVLNLYSWFELVASHELRHTKQMRQITATLPKDVAISQK
jgi:DinB superfamily